MGRDLAGLFVNGCRWSRITKALGLMSFPLLTAAMSSYMGWRPPGMLAVNGELTQWIGRSLPVRSVLRSGLLETRTKRSVSRGDRVPAVICKWKDRTARSKGFGALSCLRIYLSILTDHRELEAFICNVGHHGGLLKRIDREWSTSIVSYLKVFLACLGTEVVVSFLIPIRSVCGVLFSGLRTQLYKIPLLLGEAYFKAKPKG